MKSLSDSKNKNCEHKVSAKTIQKLLPVRKAFDNKSTAGRSLLVAGNKGLHGAAILAATAAARVGSGYSNVLTPSRDLAICKNPDLIFHKLNRDFDLFSIKFNSIGVGPGLGKLKYFSKIIKSLRLENIENVVLDADALNFLSKSRIRKLPKTWILTPHEGELARLIHRTSDYVKANRLASATEAQKKYDCLVVLKGSETIVKTAQASYLIEIGHPALAKSGTGDVLTGMIVGFLAQGLNSLNACLCGVYVHGLCSQFYVNSGRDPLSLLASELVDYLPFAISSLRKK